MPALTKIDTAVNYVNIESTETEKITSAIDKEATGSDELTLDEIKIQVYQ